MGALRKAGVWLGLVEDEEDRPDDGLFDDEFGEEDDFATAARPRSLARPATGAAERDSRRDTARHDPVRPDAGRGDSGRGDSGRTDAGRGDSGRSDPGRSDTGRSDTGRHETVRHDPARDSLRHDAGRHDGGRHDGGRQEDVRDRLVRDRAPRDSDLREGDSRAERELRELRAHREAVERDARPADRGVRGSELPEPRPGDSRSVDGRQVTDSRGSVRQLARPSTPSTGSTAVSFPTQDNLALAPQVQLRERAVAADDRGNSRRPQITTLHPTSYSEARAIGERFRDGYPVIMNLTEMDEPDAKRLVDFAAGLAFGLRGGMERVTNRVFLLSPPNIQVSAEDKARIAEAGFFDQT